MVNLGVIFNTRASWGQRDRARELFETAAAIAKDYALAWLNLGHYWAAEGGLNDIGTRNRAVVVVQIVDAHAERISFN